MSHPESVVCRIYCPFPFFLRPMLYFCWCSVAPMFCRPDFVLPRSYVVLIAHSPDDVFSRRLRCATLPPT